MTCIVGLVNDGRVYVAGDSAGMNPWTYGVSIRADTKVFRVGAYAMGFTDSFRMGQLLRYRLAVEEPGGWDVDRFMVETFVERVRKTLADGGYASKTNNVEIGGTFLVGVRGLLYTVMSDFQVARSVHGYAAVGCGEGYALGAFHALDDTNLDPEEKIKAALCAASYHSAGVAPPFEIVKTDSPARP